MPNKPKKIIKCLFRPYPESTTSVHQVYYAVSVCYHKGIFCLVIMLNFIYEFSLFVSRKNLTKLFNKFSPLVLKKRSSSKLDTPNPSTSIIILNKLYLFPYLIILLLYLENFFDFFVLDFGSTHIV